MVAVKGVGAALMSLLLAGCYTAEPGVLDPSASVVPQQAVTVLVRDEPMELEAEGRAYAIMNPQTPSDRKVLVRLWPVTDDGLYIAAFWPRDWGQDTPSAIIFAVMKVRDGHAEVSGDCDGPTLQAALSAGAQLAGAEPRAGRKSCHFDNSESVFDFAKAIAAEPLWSKAHKVMPFVP